MDFSKYKSSLKHPNMKELREQLKTERDLKPYTVPKTGYFDAAGFDRDVVEPVYDLQRRAYNADEKRLLSDFRRDAEKEYGFDHLPRGVKDIIHSAAWNRGHSGGLAEVAGQYAEIVEPVIELFNIVRAVVVTCIMCDGAGWIIDTTYDRTGEKVACSHCHAGSTIDQAALLKLLKTTS